MSEPLCTSSLLSYESPLFGSVAQIDTVLAHLDHIRRRFLTARNTLVPVSRLPLEVLSMIFLHLLPVPSDPFTPPSSQDVRTASQTCTFWRAAALGCAVLWAYPETRGVHALWTAEMLRRSLQVSLSLYGRISCCAGNDGLHLDRPWAAELEAYQLVLTHADRIAELHLEGSACMLAGLCRPELACAPRLRSLIVVHTEYTACTRWMLRSLDAASKKAGAAGGWAGFWASFLSGGAPALERLDLRECVVDWDAPVWKSCSGLRSLVIKRAPGQGVRATLEGVLGVLQDMKQLRTLKLEVRGLSREVLGEMNAETVALDELEELSWRGTAIGFASLLNHLALPARTSIVSSHSSVENVGELPALYAALSVLHSAPAPRQRSIRSVYAHAKGFNSELDIHFHPDRVHVCGSQCKAHEKGSTFLSLGQSPMENLRVSAMLRDMLNVLPLHHVESFGLEDPFGDIDAQSRKTLLALCPRVGAISPPYPDINFLLVPDTGEYPDEFSRWFTGEGLPN